MVSESGQVRDVLIASWASGPTIRSRLVTHISQYQDFPVLQVLVNFGFSILLSDFSNWYYMDGDRGLRAWRWLFLIEGSLTVALAAMAVFVLPDYPNSTRWLSAEEKHMASGRLSLDSGLTLDGNMDDHVTGLQGLLLAVKDPKVWLLGITYHATIMGLTPPWIWAMLVSLPNAWHADRSGERFLHYFGPALACIVGYIISATTTTVAPRYFSMFLMTTGFASGFIMLAWISNTIPYPRAKKAAAIAMVNAMGNIGSIPGSYIWPAKYGPLYVKSFGAMIAILGFGCVCALFLRFYLIAQNKKLDRAENMAMTASGDDREKAVSTVVRMDKSFRYLY